MNYLLSTYYVFTFFLFIAAIVLLVYVVMSKNMDFLINMVRRICRIN